MGLKLLSENTGWEAALEIAVEWDLNVQKLCKAVLKDDHKTAKLLAKELKNEENDRTDKSFNRISSRN